MPVGRLTVHLAAATGGRFFRYAPEIRSCVEEANTARTARRPGPDETGTMTTSTRRHSLSCSVLPPYLLEEVAARAEGDVARRARRTIEIDDEMRAARVGRTPAVGTAPPGEPNPRRTVSDAHQTRTLPGTPVRREGDPSTGEPAVDEAYDGLGATWTLFDSAYDRDSVDGAGLPLLASVHYAVAYDNAFWDGTQMVFGDGDGELFNRFTASVDVIGHELTHGVTEYTAGLMYQGEPGALNESVSDVFGSLVKQWVLGQTAVEADWLIGAELLTDAVDGVAIRSMKAPGTAYDDAILGHDPQPAHMDDYVITSEDNGGVHINSGIPNHAFYLAAVAVGGHAWESVGLVWYDTLTGEVQPDCDFETFAHLTIAAAATRFGAESDTASAVRTGWEQVGVLVPAEPPAPPLEHTGIPEPVDETGPTGSGVPEDPEKWTLVVPPPPARAELNLVRTGGLAGIRRERTVQLSQLPGADTRTWQTVLASRELRVLGAVAGARPDSFCYRVSCHEAEVDVDLPEGAVPERVQALLERTLTGSTTGSVGV
jgi:hypothetical protein